MFAGVRYVLRENFSNLYRIYSIAKYELLSDIRDSKLGIFWNFAGPVIKVLTYWFAFGVVFQRRAIEMYGLNVPYIFWQMGGMVVWFFISPCITNGCSAIHAKINVITKMKFPVSILPATVIAKELFNHACLMVILTILLCIGGYYPSYHWLGLIYYCFCGICFTLALALVTSVLTMLYRDIKKLVVSLMQLLLYMTPILWNINNLDAAPQIVKRLMNANPVYYVVQGYRDCFFYHKGLFFYHKSAMLFWGITVVLFLIGSRLMYKFKLKFIDLY